MLHVKHEKLSVCIYDLIKHENTITIAELKGLFVEKKYFWRGTLLCEGIKQEIRKACDVGGLWRNAIDLTVKASLFLPTGVEKSRLKSTRVHI